MFFLRQYNSGKAKSGTTDIATWEEFPPFEEFRALCESYGAGKYVMFERGKGIRGMRKVSEYVVDESVFSAPNHSRKESELERLLVFAAEEFGVEPETVLSVKQKMSLSDMSDSDLMGALDQMTKSAEGEDSLARDVRAIIRELKTRTLGADVVKEAEATSKLGGKMGFGAGMLVGGLGGVAATAYHYRGKIQDMESRMAAMEASMKETEQELKKEAEERKKQQKQAEAVRRFDSAVNLDAAFLAEFNRKNTTKDF
jgi:Sec-independent protein translocase protein TatA